MDTSRGEPNPTNGERVDTMTKMTYVSAIEFALDTIKTNMDAMGGEWVDTANEVVPKLEALKATIAKRNASKDGERKPTKTQRENVGVKERICEFLTHTLQGVTCGDIAKELDISSQKCSALLTQLVREGTVTKRMEKRTALFLLTSTVKELEGDDDPDQLTDWERNTMN